MLLLMFFIHSLVNRLFLWNMWIGGIRVVVSLLDQFEEAVDERVEISIRLTEIFNLSD